MMTDDIVGITGLGHVLDKSHTILIELASLLMYSFVKPKNTLVASVLLRYCPVLVRWNSRAMTVQHLWGDLRVDVGSWKQQASWRMAAFSGLA